MSEISKDDHDYVNSRRRDAAIVIDEAEQAVPISERDGSFDLAMTAIRGWRPRIESARDREQVMRYLKELDQDLRLVEGKAKGAVYTARQLIADAHFNLATTRNDVPGGICK
jgi:hypothetical protein